ncbi:MAG: class I SAM-dependent methyltransferase [Lachnospiraceae bacterium]|nr:class I SAM-dependent methyltransferase [Lachnospiraceae bacterium]
MNEKDSYKDIVSHYEHCFQKHGDNCKGVDWPRQDDVFTRYDVMLDVIRFDPMCNSTGNTETVSDIDILDFGCGLGHLYDYIQSSNQTIGYTGLDISDLFADECRKKYPGVEFLCKDILKEDLERNYSYIIMNGVFTEKVSLSYDEMKDYFERMIKRVFEYADRGIAFNVMSKDVDWERDDLFHLPLNELSSFLCRDISRNYIVRNDYGLYEYTVYVYK